MPPFLLPGVLLILAGLAMGALGIGVLRAVDGDPGAPRWLLKPLGGFLGLLGVLLAAWGVMISGFEPH